MTIFEGMCIGFLAGVVMSLISICLGAWIDDHINSLQHNIFNRDRDRSSDNGLSEQKGVKDDK